MMKGELSIKLIIYLGLFDPINFFIFQQL